MSYRIEGVQAAEIPDSRGRPTLEVTTDELIDRYVRLVDQFPIVSIEDGLAEDDREGWERLTRRLGDRVQLVGDDIFVTSPGVIHDAFTRRVANAALIKVNQIGTVTETLEAIDVCRAGGYGQMVSHRSGETVDSFIADLTVAAGCGQLKAGAPHVESESPSTTACWPLPRQPPTWPTASTSLIPRPFADLQGAAHERHHLLGQRAWLQLR